MAFSCARPKSRGLRLGLERLGDAVFDEVVHQVLDALLVPGAAVHGVDRDDHDGDAGVFQALFGEAVQAMLAGDLDTAKAALRAYINATVGFEKLAATTGTPVKSLMRMFGPKGNPTAANLSEVIRVLQKKTGVHLEVRASAA